MAHTGAARRGVQYSIAFDTLTAGADDSATRHADDMNTADQAIGKYVKSDGSGGAKSGNSDQTRILRAYQAILDAYQKSSDARAALVKATLSQGSYKEWVDRLAPLGSLVADRYT
jgi:hypothetical protein